MPCYQRKTLILFAIIYVRRLSPMSPTKNALLVHRTIFYGQVVVICGKNAAVKRELEATEWPSNSRVIVKGFVSNMDEWMGAVDALVTKAGPGTIAEATIRCETQQQ